MNFNMENFVISLYIITFVIGIVRSHDLMIRELSTSPFPIKKVDVNKKLKIMTKRKTIIEVKSDFYQKWGYVYDYSLIEEYINCKQPLPILCQKHGLFLMPANSHLRGCGCPKCANEKTGDRCRMTLKEFLMRSFEIHGNFYDYSLINENNFIDSRTKVDIICPLHGKFKQTPHSHLTGRGCYKCGKQRMASTQALTRDEVVRRCNDIFDYKYDYSLFNEYHSKKDIIRVICPVHGAWNVSVNNHLYNKSGCPSCKRSFGEEQVAKFLNANHIEYKEQYRIHNSYLFCKNTIILIDFYLPKFNAFIEYNGIQHYKKSPIFNMRTFEQQQERDNAVKKYCKEYRIKLIEIPYTKYDNIASILKMELKI